MLIGVVDVILFLVIFANVFASWTNLCGRGVRWTIVGISQVVV